MINNPFRKSKKIKLPPRYDEFMDLVTEHGFDAAIIHVQKWIKEAPDEPGYYRYLTTAYEQLNRSAEANQSAAQYFVCKKDSVLTKEQREQRVQSDERWLNNILESNQVFPFASALFSEIAALAEGVNQRLYFSAVKRLAESDSIEPDELSASCLRCHEAMNGEVGVLLLKRLDAVGGQNLVEHAVRADLYFWGGEFRLAITALEQVIDNGDKCEDRFFQLANAQLKSNQIQAAFDTLEKMNGMFEPNKRRLQALKKIKWILQLGAQVLPVSEIIRRVGDVPCRLLSPNQDALALFVDGSVDLGDDLALDRIDSGYPGHTAGFGLVIKGDLTVGGSITNYCGDTGASLIVLGNLQAEHLIGGASEIIVRGDTTLLGALIGHGNHGSIVLHGSVSTKLIWNDNHDLNYNYRHDPEIQIDVGFLVESNHGMLPLLAESFRSAVVARIESDYADDIEDEKCDFQYPVYFTDFVVPELLAGKRLTDLIVY